MQVELILHPATPASPVERIAVEVERLGEVGLRLTYRLFGDLARLKLPELGEGGGRSDGLWKHTCFEAFVKAADQDAYLELNFATPTAWSSYQFSGYRQDMRSANVEPWTMQANLGPPFEFEVEIVPGRMARLDLATPAWSLGLATVVEDIDGAISYWALAHPSAKPDFHHPDSFVLRLPPEPA